MAQIFLLIAGLLTDSHRLKFFKTRISFEQKVVCSDQCETTRTWSLQVKLRILQQSLRFRLSQKDVEELISGNELENMVQLSPVSGEHFRITLRRCHMPSKVTLQDRTLQVQFADKLCQNLASIDIVTIEEKLDVGDGNFLRIMLEKDFACLKPREGSDDFDTFKHPNEQSASC